MSEIEQYLKEAFLAATSDQYPDLHMKMDMHPIINLFDLLDSLSIVAVLIETENLLQIKLGGHISLADETIFDASKSPFLTWSAWVSYVNEKYDHH